MVLLWQMVVLMLEKVFRLVLISRQGDLSEQGRLSRQALEFVQAFLSSAKV